MGKQEKPYFADRKEMGRRLRIIREVRAGMSVKQAAEASGLDPADIVAYERGHEEPELGHLVGFAAAYGLRTTDLATAVLLPERSRPKSEPPGAETEENR